MKQNKKPFFAAFLEKQIQEPNKINGGKANVTFQRQDSPVTRSGETVTMKYPSDSDEGVAE